MKRDELSTLIRQLLVEELAVIRDELAGGAGGVAQVREEFVSIRTEADLGNFVHRLLELAKDGKARADIEAGRHVFRLTPGASAPMASCNNSSPTPAPNASSVGFGKGLITEKEIMALPEGLGSIQVGKGVCFTPLALDELRLRGIKVERAKS